MIRFHNRLIELDALQQHWDSHEAELILLYGRRRLGKTYLLQKFLEDDKQHAYFLAAQTSLRGNLSGMATALIQMAPDKGYRVEDLSTLGNILRFAASLAGTRRLALVLDEFQYLLEQEPSIPSQIQSWWDTEGIRSSLFLVLCGSHAGMMEGLGGPQAPLFGRFTFRWRLPPMTYRDVSLFYEESSYSPREKLTAFGVLGGTPRYHALFDPRRSLSANIAGQIFSSTGLLRNEPDILLSSSRIRDAAPYNAILRAIADGCTKSNEIGRAVGASSSQLAFYLRTLIELEWVGREHPFGEDSDRRAIYRLNDPFIRFWYRFVDGLRSDLEFQNWRDVYRTGVQPFLNDYMGFLAFEDICHQFLRVEGSRLLGVGIRNSSRYWSRDTSLEVDVMGETADGGILLGECRWSSSPVGPAAYQALRDKAALLREKRGRIERYILFSAAGFSENLRATAEREGVLLVDAEKLLSAGG